MIILLFSTLILFLNSYALGGLFRVILQRVLRYSSSASLFEQTVLGIIVSFVYFNILSLFLPVSYYTLIPLIATSCMYYATGRQFTQLWHQLYYSWKYLLEKKRWLFLIPFLLLYLLYGILPPSNWDSMGYHFTTIEWYEKYKAIPGLANVHGRYAFNPANFIISAAYSFSSLIRQAVYPLNYVLVLLFYGWLLKQIIEGRSLLIQLILLGAAFFLFQISLVNIASPSSDLLSGILVFYCGYRAFQLIGQGKKDVRDYFTIFVFICFATTAKLSASLSFLLLPILYFFSARKGKSLLATTTFLVIVALIYIPWLARNVILSGCLVYPILQTKLNFFDWTVTDNIVKLDYFFSKYGPGIRTIQEFDTVAKTGKFQFLLHWMQLLQHENVIAYAFTVAAMLSPLAWLYLILFRKENLLLLGGTWLVYYTCFWLWLLNSPEVRFGVAYIILSMCIPLLCIGSLQQNTSGRKWLTILAIPVWFLCIYYMIRGWQKSETYPFSLSDVWLKPLRTKHYFLNRQYLPGFPSAPLDNGVRVYFADSVHNCLNATGPCMTWRYGEIEMRGKTVAEGFRLKKDEIEKNYPFVKTLK